MDLRKIYRGIKPISFSFLLFLTLTFTSTPLKVKVIVDNASIKVRPEIGGETLARVPLNTVLEAEIKEGEWYKVIMDKEGVRFSGFIHEMLVEVVKEGELAEPDIQIRAERPQVEIIAEIEAKVEENRKWIRQEREFDRAINSLRPLVAKVFQIADNEKQKELAAEIFLWIGLAYAGQNDDYSALMEFKNMFEVDRALAKEITRNIYDPNVNTLIHQAENEFLGLITEYSLEISTEPKEAEIKINGEKIGLSPEVYRTIMPKFVIEIERKGYKAVKEEIFLTQPATKKEYTLERIGRDVEVRSNPSGAKIYLDGIDTEMVTDCVLRFIPFGIHKIKVIKENYTEWEEEVEVEEGKELVPIEVTLTAKKYMYLKKWGGPKQGIFKQPVGIAIDKESNIYVIDVSDFKIKKFSPDGQFQSHWGREGKEFKSLKNPAGIAVSSQGYVFVTDVRNHCVMKFGKDGKFLKKWGKEGNGMEEFKSPIGVAVDSNNNVYIADSGNHRVKKYSHLGVLEKVWGRQGVSDGDFIFPTAVALNQNNEVYVLDRNRVQKFSSEGEFIVSWGKIGTGDGEFKKPMGICVDSDNFIYMADSSNNRIQKFNERGHYITKWGSRGEGDGQMNFPFGIAVDSKGYVFVVERDNNRVQVFGVATQSEPMSD